MPRILAACTAVCVSAWCMAAARGSAAPPYGLSDPNIVIVPRDDDAQMGGAVGRILQDEEGSESVPNITNGTAQGAPVALNYTQICPEQGYPAEHAECLPMLYIFCRNSNFTAEVSTFPDVDCPFKVVQFRLQ